MLTLNKNSNQQDQRFILSPMTGSMFMIYCDGSLFCYLLKQKPKDIKSFIEHALKLSAWTPEAWFQFCIEFFRAFQRYFLWVIPYFMVQRNRDYNSFKMGDVTENNDVDLPSCYSTCIPSWNEQYTATFSCPDGIPQGEATDIFKVCHGNGLAFICAGDLRFNPVLMESPTQLICQVPKQNGSSYGKYLQ